MCCGTGEWLTTGTTVLLSFLLKPTRARRWACAMGSRFSISESGIGLLFARRIASHARSAPWRSSQIVTGQVVVYSTAHGVSC